MPESGPFELLVPRPRAIRRNPGSVQRAMLAKAPAIVRESGTAEGGYRLELTTDGARITASDEAGARFGAATLAQIRRLPGDTLPCARIEDAPALARRGLMLDVSRCRVPRMSEFAGIAESLATLKFDHLQCYTEHAFAYSAHEPVWRDTDPITPEQARSLDDLCRRHGIELAANQNCFGHLSRFLRHPGLAHLAETQGDWTFLDMPRSGPFSLCPIDPGSRPFVEGLLDELLPCFASPLVNIGCDETYDVGQGRSEAAVRAEGKAAVYGRFVASVCDAVKRRGKSPMFWADIANEHPEALELIPSDAHAMVWGYEPGHGFASEGRRHADAGRAWWACPGTSSWRTFTGRSQERSTNIREAARAGVDHGAAGLLVTDWGDVGHRQVWPVALLGIAETGDAAWTGAARSPRFLEAVSLQVFGDTSQRTAGWLEELGDADEPLRAVAGVRGEDGAPSRLLNASALFTELHPPPLPLSLPAEPGLWRACRDRLEDLWRRVPSGAGTLVERELRHACDCALWACDVALSRRGDETPPADLTSRLDRITREQATLWTERSRRGGLSESLAYWDEIPLDAASGAPA